MKMKRKAFTLIELLVVISIIAILGAGGMAVFTFGGGSRTISSAQQSMMIMFQEARLISSTKQTRARIIIYKGPDIERKYRQVGIIYETYDIQGNVLGWVASGNGYRMPRGVFFIPDKFDFEGNLETLPQFNVNQVFPSTFNNSVTTAPNVVGITEFPSLDPQNCQEGNGDWYSYEFSPDGLSENPGARIMLGVGNMNGKGVCTITNPYVETGFVVRRTGITSGFKDYSEIEEVSK